MKNFTLREEIKAPQAFITEKKNGRLKKRDRLNNKTVLSKLLLLSFLVLTTLPSFAQQKQALEFGRATKPNIPYAPKVKENKGGLEYQTMAVAGSISVAENATYNAYTAEQLVKNLFVTGCLSASNVRFGYYRRGNGNTYTWQDHTWSSTPGNRQLAYFNKATSTFPIDEGLLLTTGKASSAMGPNNTGGSTDEMVSSANDPDLASITGRTIYDASTLEFDFVPAGNTLEFKYVFSSEEYLEYCETGYNDAFGFFLSGPGISGPYRNNAINLALLPSSTTPISINTIHAAGTNVNNVNFPAVNGQYYQNNASGSTTTQFDGNTVILTATYPVTPCSTYRIKLSIGDASDQQWDSGVFLGARSFNSENIVLTNYGNMIENQNNIFEGCNNKFRVQRTGSDISQPLVVNLLLSGTFTNGVDIQTTGGQPFPTQVTIPANQTYIDIPYTTIADAISDNSETFIVRTITSCPCSSNVVYVTQTMNIYETAVLNSINATNAQCNGQNNGTLTVNVSGGSGSYLYSINNGANWQSINTFSNLSPGNYTVIVRDPGSCKPNLSGTATIGNPTPIVANAGPDVTICPGGNTQLSGSGGVVYSWSPSTGLNFTNIANPIASPTTTTTYTLTVTNASGQCTSTDQVVVNVDAAPVAPTAANVNNNNICSNVGGNIILSATGGSGTTLKWYTSSCGGTAIGTGNNLSIAAPTQTTTYYVRWENSCGNSACAQVTVTVKPTVTLTGPANASIQGCNQSSITPLTYSETPVSITLAQFQSAGGTTSNASLAHTITYKDTKTGSCPTVVTRVFTVATDCTTANFTQTITINDTTAPTFNGTLPAASITASCGNIPAAATLTATDACGTATVTFAETRTNGSCAGNYTLTRKWTATDLCGNTAEHTQTVTVTDTQAPVFAGTLPAASITASCGNIPAAATLTATDACGSATVTFAETRTDGACAGSYTLTRKWTATDLCGNTAEHTQTVTVTDTQAPVFAGTLPAASITASCGNIPTAATLTATDACGSATVTFAETRTNGSCAGSYTLTRKWTATDLCGNTAEHTQTVTVTDTQAPTFTGTLPAASINASCGNIPTAATLTATDACGSATVTFAETRTDGSCAGSYTLTRKWTATDLCGNTAEHTQTVTVTDTQAPVFAGTLPSSITAACGNIPAAATLTATDACGSATVTFAETRTDGACAGSYTLTRKWTATDLCGNTAEHTQTVTVTDTQAPVFAGTLPSSITAACGNIPAAATLTATDACGSATVTFTETKTDGACAGSYTLTRKWTATDLCGNTAEHTQTVTVTDTQAPTFTGTLPAASITASCGNIPAAATLTATDACGSATVTFAETRTDGACAGSYTLTRKWTATDLCGNTAEHTQTVTVTDTQAPVFAGTLPAASITASCGNIPAAATLTATDACGSATVTFAETRTDGACAGSYTLTRKWTATDLCGNTAEHTQTVTVTDTQAPVFAGTLPAASITASCGNIPTAATLTATDACGSATVTFAETRTDGACAGSYTLTRKWTATDLCGNTAEHTQVVTVSDTQAPVFAGTLPSNITASCENIPAAATLTATDACGSATVTFAETRTDGACAGSYTLTRKWTATDLCGNTAEHTQVVTVSDTQAPVFAGTLPSNITASCENIPAAATLTATDACGSATVTFAETRTDGACAGSYTLTRKWTATDLCGNTAEHTQTVTVTDTQAPTFVGTPPADIAISCGNIPAAATLTATDACGSATVTFAETRTDGACAGSYILTRKWTATDLCGNTAVHTQIITVQDNVAPTFTGTLPAASITASCGNIPTAATLTATDACGSATVTFAETRTDGACAGSYTLTRKWTATDLCGNTAEHIQTVTVTDTQAPVFAGTLPSNITASCENIPAAATLTATDACGSATVTFAETRTDGACAGSYTLTRKWTATDLCGNIAEHTQVVTVTDAQSPTFVGILPAAEVAASCDNIPAAATLTATDACGTATVTFAEIRTDGACAGSYTLTRKWTATDLCGNTAEYTQVVTITDTQAPVFAGTLPAASITASCANIPAAATLTATDACGSATVTFAETRTDGACAGSYTLTRKWTATDLCGNTAIHTQTVTVTDTQAPVFAGTLPSNITASCENVPTAATLTATDACGSATVTFAEIRTDGACAGSYTLTRKWTATDLCGNTAEHIQIVTIQDNVAPTFTGTVPADIAISCGNIPAAATLTATDACGSATVTFAETRTEGACAGSYTLTRKWTATDLCGNTAVHTQTVTVQDNVAPTFTETLPSDITASCENIPTAVTLTATDACGSATVTFAETRTDGACAGSYTLTRKWTATDLCGNTAVHTQTVTVQDNVAPTFTGTLPSNITASCENIPTAATLTATDACGSATVTFAETRTDGACAGSYTLTRKWTATDLCGNTAEHTQVVTVTDAQSPTFVGTLPAAEVAASCDNIPAAATLTATDACGSATVTFAETRTDGACAGSYTLTRKWTATDLCGNTAEYTQVVTITDTQAPVFAGTLPAAEVAASCDNIPAAATLTATDACGSATVTLAETRTDGACAGSYTLTRKWTATDLCGNIAEHTQVVTVTDTQAPVFAGTLPSNITASCENVPAAATLIATDACGSATVTFAETRTDGACAGSYTLTRKWTATDLCGNTAEHTQVVTVTDTQAPVFAGTLPAAEVAASCDNIPAAATLTATDACGSATVTFAETRTDGACAGSYTLTRKWTATDLCGNTAEHTQVVTVTDTQAPVFAGTLPAAEVAASCDNIPAAATLTATDACGSTTVTLAETRTDGACAGSYTLTRKWTATDLCGNIAEHTQVVTVTDTQAPVFAGTLPAAEVAASCDNIPAAATLTATDACGSATVTLAETRTDGACAGSYTLTRKWTATDLCGNTAEHTQVVTVTDTQAPVFAGTLPAAEVAASCDNIPAAATLTATDACGSATVTFAETRTDGACAGSYTLTRKWTATDLCGNTAEHTQVVTVTDTQAPVFAGTLPAAEVAASCDNIPAAATLTATDACGSATVTFAETRTDGACAGSYTLTRKWTATDLCGNTAEHTQVVTVTDTQAPAFDGTLPAAEVAASCDNIPAAATLTATDACGSATVTFAETRTDGACAGSYTLTRKWTATDLCGNIAEHTQVVTVTDTQAPAFAGTLPAAEVAASCDNIPVAATLSATDACGSATVTFAETRTDGACAGSYTLTRKWTATDLCGNIAEHTQVVTVTDTQAPAFAGTLPAAEVAASCDNIPVAATLSATDACGSATVTFAETRTDGACAGSYTLTRKWTATDLCGNTAEHTQVVTVTDTQAPVFAGTLPAAEVAASCDNIPAAATLTATDACGSATVTFAETRTDGACAGSYTLTRKWTATDLCGNIAEHTQVVTVTDTQAPVFAGTLPAAEVAASCDNIPAAATLTATDACGSATVTFAETRTDGACAGSYTLTRKWTATDLCGNIAEHTQVVTVTDTQAPAFAGTLPAAEVAASCDNIPAAATLTATDACGSATVTFAETRTDGACAGSYTLTRKWTASDLCGNTVDHTQVVTVTDTQAPAFDGTLPAAEVAASCDNIPAAATLTATDACGTATVTLTETRTDGACAGSYTLTRKWTASDLCGNTVDHTQVVTVTDTQAPAFDGTLPAAEVAASCDNIPAAATLTATDACGSATVTFAETRTDGACAGSYTLTRKWTATDLCGNTVDHTQVVTVTDNQGPTFVETVPTDVTVACGAVPTAPTLTATDNCSMATVTMLETIENGACAGDKIITRTWTAVDLCNNVTSVTQVITVEDNTAPTLVTPLETTINVVCSEIPEAPALEFTDSCSSVENVIFDEQIENQTATGYTIIRSWSVTDSCGNSNVVTQTINVAIAPTETIASELCIEDLSIDLFTLLDNSVERTGTWIDTNNSRGLTGNIFNPTNVALGDYILSYVIADGDCPRTIQVNMNVNDDCIVLAPCEVIVHNAMTPNGDGLNEFFKIEGLDCYPNNSVEIYNRWGVLVFDAQGYDNNTKVFRGVSEGRATVKKSEELPDGTYYYVLKYVDAEGKSREKASYLYINR